MLEASDQFGYDTEEVREAQQQPQSSGYTVEATGGGKQVGGKKCSTEHEGTTR